MHLIIAHETLPRAHGNYILPERPRHSERETHYYLEIPSQPAPPEIQELLRRAGEQIPGGMYAHYKGGHYLVLALVYLPAQREVCVWYDPKDPAYPHTALRPVEHWLEPAPGGVTRFAPLD